MLTTLPPRHDDSIQEFLSRARYLRTRSVSQYPDYECIKGFESMFANLALYSVEIVSISLPRAILDLGHIHIALRHVP